MTMRVNDVIIISIAGARLSIVSPIAILNGIDKSCEASPSELIEISTPGKVNTSCASSKPGNSNNKEDISLRYNIKVFTTRLLLRINQINITL